MRRSLGAPFEGVLEDVLGFEEKHEQQDFGGGGS